MAEQGLTHWRGKLVDAMTRDELVVALREAARLMYKRDFERLTAIREKAVV